MIVLGDIKRARGVVKTNPGASLVDLGDGVLCLEFHSKMNALGEDMVQMVAGALDELERGFEALVVANDGENFSVGANLMMVLLAAQEGEWDELDTADPALPGGMYGDEVRVAAGSGRAVRHGAGRRLRSGAARRPRAGVGGNLHGPGGDRRRA